MSRLFGEMRQIGIVVRDIEAAMQHWVEVCGVGPWFYADKLPVTAFTYREETFDDIHISVALANSRASHSKRSIVSPASLFRPVSRSIS